MFLRLGSSHPRRQFLSLALSGALCAFQEVARAQMPMAGGMSATNYRYALPFYASGATWSTTLHLRNTGPDESGISLLVRGADGSSRKRLHLVLPPASSKDLLVSSLLGDTSPELLLTGSIIIVQEISMGPLVISGAADIQKGRSRQLSIREPLVLLDERETRVWLVSLQPPLSSEVTTITSVGQMPQDIAVECRTDSGIGSHEQIALQAHATVMLRGCKPSVDLAAPLEEGGGLEATSIVVTAPTGGFVAFGFNLKTGNASSFSPGTRQPMN